MFNASKQKSSCTGNMVSLKSIGFIFFAFGRHEESVKERFSGGGAPAVNRRDGFAGGSTAVTVEVARDAARPRGVHMVVAVFARGVETARGDEAERLPRRIM